MTKIINPKQFWSFEHYIFDIVSNFGFRVSNFKSRSQQGLSLMEVIISMGMLVALFSLYTAALNTMTVTQHLRYENLAYHATSKQMETLRGTAFASLPSSGTINDTLLTQLPSGAGNFTVANYAGFAGMKEMTVIVTWNEKGGNKTFQIKTLAGSGGINP